MRSNHITRIWLPDDRLCRARIDGEGFTFEHRRWHIHPVLVRTFDEVAKQLSTGSVYLWTPSVEDCYPPYVSAWVERSAVLREPLTIRIQKDVPGLAFELAVRADMVDPALLREMNECALPAVCQHLVRPTWIPLTGDKLRPP